MTLIEEAITYWFGHRCPDQEKGCPACDAWAEYDALNPSFGDALREGMTEAITMAKLMRENEELRAYRDELINIAEQVGESDDPFAAWEAITHMQAQLAEEKALADRLYEEGARLQSKLAAITAERGAALSAVVEMGDRLQRECFGLNNEGDPIGGDPPAGWKPRAEKAEARVSELEATIAKGALWQEPKAYRIRLQSDDAEEWSLLHPKDAVDYLERDGFECQPLYAAYRKARGM